ncbi:hypothetical protein ACS78I_21390 [Yersinia enterocolitica]|uniref:hypothetical protein n=1 Tax=Yersiniaceae TaxID=1903411 RepID=UPI001AE691DE|nr:hypothetical protein [Serratia fonticola]EKN6394624.1 hypothetical protein [Yersinia enterocolitica]MBP1038909.1 hypothetical protein [Serratia fonticola]
MVDFFGSKTKELLANAQKLLQQAQDSMSEDIVRLQEQQIATDARLTRLENQQDESLQLIGSLQNAVDTMRDSAIRGEVASGQKSKDVAVKYGITPSRVTQIAPRRKYNNG